MSVAAVEPARSDEKTLLTAEEFAERYAGQRVELVKGQVVELPMPFWKHGKSVIASRWRSARSLKLVTSAM